MWPHVDGAAASRGANDKFIDKRVGTNMNSLLFGRKSKIAAVVALAGVAIVAPTFAQRGGGGAQGGGPGGPGRGPSISDPKEAAAYQAYVAAKGDKKIQAGADFVTTYPKSVAAHAVADQVVTMEYQKQDWPAFYAASDKALAIDPDDVGILAITGWVIPRNFKDGQISPTLDQAEADNKKALDLLTTLPKPATLTDDQFTSMKALAASQAHSGLGLIYAREQKPEDAAANLQQVTSPDSTDIFMLAASLETMGKHAEASEQFKKCSSMPGPLQAPCTQNAADTAKEK
jgi:hypothetical protein